MAVLNKDAMRRIAVIAGSYLEKRNALARSQESISIVEALRARLAQAEQHMETSNEALADAEKSYDDGVQALIAEHADASEETINDTAERLAMNMVAMGLGELYEPGEMDGVETPSAEASAPRRKRRSKKEMAADQTPSENDATPVVQTAASETATPSEGIVIDQQGHTVSDVPQEIPVGDPVNPEAAPDAGATITVEDPPENWIESGVATAVASVQEEIHDDIPFDVPTTPAPETETPETEAPEPEAPVVEETGSEVQPSRPVLRPVLRRPTAPRAL